MSPSIAQSACSHSSGKVSQIPSGNILLLPTKVLKVYGCASIFRTSKGLPPTYNFIGGDGRADSPGHSEKFGSYTIMELKKKVVIDIQFSIHEM